MDIYIYIMDIYIYILIDSIDMDGIYYISIDLVVKTHL